MFKENERHSVKIAFTKKNPEKLKDNFAWLTFFTVDILTNGIILL